MRAVDRLTLDEQGLVTARRSFLDPVPLAMAIASRPAAWRAWWRSGLPPLPGRAEHRHSARLATALGATRLLLGLTSVAAPQVARSAVGFHNASGGDRGLFVRLFAARDAALGAATLSCDPRTSAVGLRIGALCDLADVAAGLLARRRGMTLAAAAFAALGALAASLQPARTPAPAQIRHVTAVRPAAVSR